MERRKNQKVFIVAELLDEIIQAAQDQLFNTPIPSEIPTDSFADDFEPEFFIGSARDLSLKSLNSMNKDTTEEATTVVSSRKKRRPQKAADNKSALAGRGGQRSAGRQASRSPVSRARDKRGPGSRNSGRSGTLPAGKGAALGHLLESQTTNPQLSNFYGDQSLLNHTATPTAGSLAGGAELSMSGTAGQVINESERQPPMQRPTVSTNTIELISEFHRSKRQVISQNLQYRDWTEIFNLRDKSAAFTLEQMVKEKQELHEKKLQALPDFSSMRSLETATDNKMGLTQTAIFSTIN
jgi:hypothetical protein